MINIAIIGYGYWGPNLLRNFLNNSKCNLKWCCDIKKERLEILKKSYPNINVTTDYKDILKNKTIDAIVIATPLDTHYFIAKEAIILGKHVLIEKPFTSNVKQAEALINLAQKHNVIIMVGHTYLYSPSILKIKDILNNNELGDLHYINSMRTHFGHIRPQESVCWDLASHDLSIIFFLLKKYNYTIFCSGIDSLNRGHIDTANIVIKFNGSLPIVYLFTSWLAPIKIRNMIIKGSKKMISLNDLTDKDRIKIYNQKVLIKNSKTLNEREWNYYQGDVLSPDLDDYEPLSAEIDDFLSCIIYNKEPRSNVFIALNVIKGLEAINKSLIKNKEISV